jgi:phosphoribosylglycinamide formyltransferase-1
LDVKKIVLFASGSGSNVENIVHYFGRNDNVQVAAVFTNKRNAQVLDRCDRLNINAIYFNRHAFLQGNFVLNILKGIQPDLIVLAGFLWKIPENMIDAFPNKIINIHPALLPKYGGKGMYGMNVHTAVKENKETETGITIHYVNAHYDKGTVIQQVKTVIFAKDSPEDIAVKVQHLEYEHFPTVIEEVLKAQN